MARQQKTERKEHKRELKRAKKLRKSPPKEKPPLTDAPVGALSEPAPPSLSACAEAEVPRRK